MSFIVNAYENRRLYTSLTLQDSSGNPLTIGASDKIRVSIGSPSILEIESGTPTANGSSVTANAESVLTITTADMTFGVGVYELQLDLYESATGEYKTVSSGVLNVQNSLEDGQGIVSWADIDVMIDTSGYTDREKALLTRVVKGIEQAIKEYIKYDPIYKEDRVEYYPRGVGQNLLESTEYLALLHLPVRGIGYVKEDAAGQFGSNPDGFSDDTILTISDDYYVEWDFAEFCSTGHLIRTSGTSDVQQWNNGVPNSWCKEAGSVEVCYTSGYTQEELQGTAENGVDASGLRTAGMMMFQKMMDTFSASTTTTGATVTGQITGESLGDYSYTVDGASLSLLAGQKAQLTAEIEQWLEPYRSFNQLGL